jgi:hypothetical protein
MLSVFKFFKMSDQARSFYGECKVNRAPVIPVFQKFNPWKTIKSNVQFYRIEMLTVEIKPPVFCQPLRIEKSFPFRIMIT